MNSFMLCHDPLGRIPEGRLGYIYHYKSPKFLATIIEIDYSKALSPSIFERGQNILFSYYPGEGLERIFDIMVVDGGGGDRNFKKIQYLLTKAAEWYASCLNQEDMMKAFGKQSTWSPMRDYSPLTPDLQVLHIQAFDQYLLSLGNMLALVNKREDLQKIIDMYAKDGSKIGPGELNFI